MKRERKARRSPKRSLPGVGKTSSTEHKLTTAAMLLSYHFEYGINFRDRIINVTGEIDDGTFDLIDAAITEMEAQSRKDITIKLNSPGGETYAAMAIVDRIKESKCKITTKGYGCVASAATLILASGTRRREAAKGLIFMWHESSYIVDGSHSQNKSYVKQAEREEEVWCVRMAEASNKTKKFWKTKGVGIDAYFSAEELLTYGVVDELF